MIVVFPQVLSAKKGSHPLHNNRHCIVWEKFLQNICFWETLIVWQEHYIAQLRKCAERSPIAPIGKIIKSQLVLINVINREVNAAAHNGEPASEVARKLRLLRLSASCRGSRGVWGEKAPKLSLKELESIWIRYINIDIGSANLAGHFDQWWQALA